MKTGILKAIIGFFLLGIILGGFYYTNHYLLKNSVNHEVAVKNYNIDRLKISKKRFLSINKDHGSAFVQGDIEESKKITKKLAPKAVSNLVVRGIIRDVDLKPVTDKVVEVVVNGGERYSLKKSKGWFVSPVLNNVKELSLLLKGQDFSAGSFPVDAPKESIIFNWNLGSPKRNKEKVRFLDLVSVEVAEKLYVYYHGSADLPDGAVLLLSFMKDDLRWSGDAITIKNKAFSGSLLPMESGYPSGVYKMQLDFSSLDQPNEVLDYFGEKVPSWSISSMICIGDLSKLEAEKEEEKETLQKIVIKAQNLLHKYIYFCRLGITAKGGPSSLTQNLRKYFPKGVPKVSLNGKLNIPVWRFWIDEYFIPEIDGLNKILSFRKVPVEVKRFVLVKAYLKNIRRLIQVGSMWVYSVSGLWPDGRDCCHISLDLEDEYKALVEKLLGKKVFGRVVLSGFEGNLKKTLFPKIR